MKRKHKPNSMGKYNSSLETYMNSISGFEVLTHKRERQIIEEIQNGEAKSREKLVQGCLRFVVFIAARYSHLQVPIEDLISDGNYGLIKAAENFDVTRDCRFISFAHYHISGAILSSIHLNSSLIRIPKYITQKRARIEKKLKDNLAGKTDLNDESEILKDYNDILNWKRNTPLYTDLCDNAINHIASEDAPIDFTKPENKEEELKKLIANAVTILPEKERNVIVLYFGLNTEQDNETFKEISDTLGMSKEGVRVVKIRALKKLKEFLINIDLEDYMDI